MKPKSYPVILHINCFEQGQSLNEALHLASEIGADGVEFRRLPGGYQGSDLDYLDELSRAWEHCPMDWISFGGPGVDLMSEDDRQIEKEISSAERFYRTAASRFPLKIVNAFTGNLAASDKPYLEYWHHGSAIATPRQWQSASDGYARLGSLAGELGFKFAFETHGVYLHDTIEATSALVERVASPHVGILWDQANLMIFREYPALDEAISAMGTNLFYVHLKNLLVPPAQFLSVCALSGGIINIREQISALYRSGYQGPLCIESPRAGDRIQFAHEDISYIKKLIHEIVV